jgi:cytoskeleton protein RodZ
VSDQPHNATVGQGEEPLAGKRLAEGRRLRDISIVEIAKELHLDEPRVRALEQNRFDVLGAPVFVKGYIRKYADIVGVSVDEVLADYAQFERRDEPPPIVGLRTRPPRDISPGPWLAAFLAIAVFAGGAWAWMSGSLDALFVAREQASLAPFETAAPAASDPAARAEPEPEPTESEFLTDAGRPSAAPAEPVDDDFAKAQDAPPVFEAPPAAPPGEGEVGLTVAFSGDCWTEVSDASGERLYFGLGQAGETMSVVGTAPLHVLLGDSEHATVQVDGEAFPIPRSARRGDTARLTINTR